ncbi:DUF6851 domain-containing protein [Neolewinella aurantiaca]|nr:T9SS type A sorting domain-containing protein [Neolewinella aurantiaca]
MNFSSEKYRLLLSLLFVLSLCTCVRAQEHSVARQWNEEMLEAIRNDFARPVVHARNLYHTSAAMYDAWALVNKKGSPALMGTVQAGYSLPVDHWLINDYADPVAASNEAISYAAYRVLHHRYSISPNAETTLPRFNALMLEMGYDTTYAGTDYLNGNPADLGNYIAEQIIAFGLQDGSNEAFNYANRTYPDPVNRPLDFNNVFSIFSVSDPNHWQTLQFPGTIIDQSGQVLGNALLPFLGAEWGQVTPFSLTEEQRTDPTPENPIRGNNPVYYDPGPPPLYTPGEPESFDMYRWGFELVLKWSSHLDPTDGVMWDISPGARGNFQGDYPTDFEDYDAFYRLHEGGTFGADGHPLNPATGEPYAPNIVPRGDYTRVLAEFWADGPASETPPGHWFSILNKVMDHPEFEYSFGGTEPMGKLEYDVKAYLTLGGAMHDAAIAAWSIKGKYDYARPITAIRWMAKNGQASEPGDPNYQLYGLRYDPGYIERLNDPAVLQNSSTLALTKVKAWIGPDAIDDPRTDVAGVGWINPALWMPYQRPNFVTPNFAGYISGHSTYSSAAATIMEEITGSAFFPGGMGEFVAPKDSFLVFERGPSVDVVLQWATYRDASDQTSLSRIWGGIHPPADDVPGRIIGRALGGDAFSFAETIFADNLTAVYNEEEVTVPVKTYPNPARRGQEITLELPTDPQGRELRIVDVHGRVVGALRASSRTVHVPTTELTPGMYFVKSTDGKLGSVFQVW